MNTTVVDGHVETARMDVHELAARLNQRLGATLVAALAGMKDRKQPTRWALHDGPVPRDAAVQRMQVAWRVWLLIAATEDEHVARRWFVGCNPLLSEQTPIRALHDGRFEDVLMAATAFASANWSDSGQTLGKQFDGQGAAPPIEA